MTLKTALEIFSNPNDLSFTVGRNNEYEKFTILIMRGPGHNFKLLLTSEPQFESIEDAVGVIKEVLNSVCESSRKFTGNHNEVNTLNEEMIERILTSLKKTKHANTYEAAVDQVDV